MVVVSHLFFFLRKYFRGRCDSGESHRPLSGTIYFPTAPFLQVQKKGVEPSRYYYHTDLNRARLPIPPLLHFVLFCCFVQATKVIINEQQRFVNIIF